jgi:hypothetical protein
VELVGVGGVCGRSSAVGALAAGDLLVLLLVVALVLGKVELVEDRCGVVGVVEGGVLLRLPSELAHGERGVGHLDGGEQPLEGGRLEDWVIISRSYMPRPSDLSAGFSKMMVVLADELWAAMAMLTTRSRRRLVFLSSFLWSDGIWSSGRPSGYSLVRRMGEAKEAAMKVAERVA